MSGLKHCMPVGSLRSVNSDLPVVVLVYIAKSIPFLDFATSAVVYSTHVDTLPTAAVSLLSPPSPTQVVRVFKARVGYSYRAHLKCVPDCSWFGYGYDPQSCF